MAPIERACQCKSCSHTKPMQYFAGFVRKFSLLNKRKRTPLPINGNYWLGAAGLNVGAVHAF